jgi:methionyl-tRNA formyltransferase
MVAEEFNLEVLKTNTVDSVVLGRLSEKGIRFAIVVAFGVLLKQNALHALSGGWFNLHYSLLPRWRGAAPVQHALISGDQITGVTLFQIDEGLDTGPILATANCEIQANDNSGDLLARLTHLGVSVLLEHIPRIESGLFSSTPQAPTGITFAPKLSRQDGKVDFSAPSSSLQSKIRGTTPEPGAWTTFYGQTLKILSAQESTADLGVGVVANIEGKVLVGCGEGALELRTVQPSGKKPMNAADWLRGLKSERVKLGDDD